MAHNQNDGGRRELASITARRMQSTSVGTRIAIRADRDLYYGHLRTMPRDSQNHIVPRQRRTAVPQNRNDQCIQPSF